MRKTVANRVRWFSPAKRRLNPARRPAYLLACLALTLALFLASERPFSVSPAPSAHPTSQWLQMASSALFIAHPSTSCMIALKKSFMPVHMRRLELFPIHGMDMGVASDVNVYTFTRFAPRIGLLGRPRPHSRQSLRTAFAASKNGTPHLLGSAEQAGQMAEMLRAKAAYVRSKRVAVRL